MSIGEVIKKVGNKYEFPDGTKAFETAINKNPEKYYTEDVLKQIDAYMQTQFKYSSGEVLDVSDAEVLEDGND